MAEKFVVDERGKRVSVILPIKEYEKMMNALEDAADERAYLRAKRRKEEFIPLREAIKLRKEKLKRNGKV